MFFLRPFFDAIIAGLIANIGKVCFVGGIDLCGILLAIPLTMGIELIIGTIFLYFMDKHGNAVNLIKNNYILKS